MALSAEQLKNCWSYGRYLLFDQLQVVPPICLRSRFVIWTIDPGPLQDGYRIVDRWRKSWLSHVPMNGDIVRMTLPLFLLDLTWNVKNGLLWTDFAPHKASVRTWWWGYSDSPVCDCGFAQQTTTHILDCPLRPVYTISAFYWETSKEFYMPSSLFYWLSGVGRKR
jgi:hypothetical protein